MRQADRAFVVEGVKVLDEALAAGAPVEAVYHSPEAAHHAGARAVLQRAERAGIRVLALREGVMERVADAATPQPVCAVVGFVGVGLDAVDGASPLLVCVDVRDPGNVGAVIRVADAAGAGGVVVCAGSADPYGPKTVRASAGSLFHLPVVDAGDAAAVLAQLGDRGYRRLATLARGGRDYLEVDFGGRAAIVLGNEASGLPGEVAALIDEGVTIPMGGRAESLNVAMTATVLCFEIARRARSSAPPPPASSA